MEPQRVSSIEIDCCSKKEFIGCPNQNRRKMAAPNSYITIKQAEISIKKFNEIGIPHHLGLLKNHKSNIEKSLALSDWDKVKKEEINSTRVIKQLKSLMLEMDILRGAVEEINLDKFDELTSVGRKKVKEAIKEYLGEFHFKIRFNRFIR